MNYLIPGFSYQTTPSCCRSSQVMMSRSPSASKSTNSIRSNLHSIFVPMGCHAEPGIFSQIPGCFLCSRSAAVLAVRTRLFSPNVRMAFPKGTESGVGETVCSHEFWFCLRKSIQFACLVGTKIRLGVASINIGSVFVAPIACSFHIPFALALLGCSSQATIRVRVFRSLKTMSMSPS